MRYGKPIKNKKRRDPRYFLNEEEEQLTALTGGGAGITGGAPPGLMQLLQTICSKKDVIFAALDSVNAKLALSAALKQLGISEAEVKQVYDGFVYLAKSAGYDVPDIESLLKDEKMIDAVKGALDKACILF